MSQPLPPATNWWFLLGREPQLSAAEIAAVLNLDEPEYNYRPPLLIVNKKINTDNLISRLGGTIKIAEEISSNLPESDLQNKIIKTLEKFGKFDFGISIYGRIKFDVKKFGLTIKNELKTRGKSARFIYNDEPVLSSVTVEKNNLIKKGIELIIAEKDGVYALAKTIAVQPFAEFGARDYGRPGRDDVSGMLPPKLAMMMVNLAMPTVGAKGLSPLHKRVLLDPFCGSGTILTEAALLGYKNLIGSDISEKAVADTQKNFDWLKIKISKLFQSDVADLPNKLASHSIDAIITEPYLGPPISARGGSAFGGKKTCAELADLYIAAFAAFKKLLKPKSTVIFLIPRYFIKGRWYTISDKIMPRLKELGFAKDRLLPEEISPSYYLLYHRPGQFVAREVWRFRLSQGLIESIPRQFANHNGH